MTSLAGRRVLLTGASAGLGAATAGALAEAGARLALLARDQAALEARAADIGAEVTAADLRDVEATTAAVERAATLLGGLDAIVNNAGIFPMGMVDGGRVEDWRAMLEVNVLGMLVATRAGIPHLRESPSGQVINVSSMGGRRVAHAGQGVYAGTKHAVHAISEGLRQELWAHRIRVTVVAPGFIRTNLGRYIHDPDQRAAMERGQIESGLAPEDVAAQIVNILRTPPHVEIVEVALVSKSQRPG